ncbi:MAG: class I SAM-dependent methyltransferase [Deltaproteobacteria bacterium]|nr:class I SAM-dependent methyltransferase [Deltaproteobacteria bacterium]
MNTVDRIIQYLRIKKVRPYIGQGARILDIGCADGALFKQLRSHISEGVGIDPALNRSVTMGNCRLIAGQFPKDLPDTQPFDAIVMLAVLEHIPPGHQRQLAKACAHLLKPGGRVVITAPSPKADRILSLLKFMRVIDGMSLEDHYGFDVTKTPAIFSVRGLTFVKSEKFQLGLNNLFVFKKTEKAK